MKKRDKLSEIGAPIRNGLFQQNDFNNLGNGEYGVGSGLSREISDMLTPEHGKEAPLGQIPDNLRGSNIGSSIDKSVRTKLINIKENEFNYDNQYNNSILFDD